MRVSLYMYGFIGYHYYYVLFLYYIMLLLSVIYYYYYYYYYYYIVAYATCYMLDARYVNVWIRREWIMWNEI